VRSFFGTGIAPEHFQQMVYTEGVKGHWTEATIGQHGELVLEHLPFEPGQPVEVLVRSKTVSPSPNPNGGLRGSVLEYDDPYDPVGGEDWDALR
jgi:hypothetical protein